MTADSLPDSATIAILAADAIRNALDGGAQYGAVDRAVYAHTPHDDSAHDELVTAVDTLLRTGHVTVTPVGTPDPAALLTEIESLRAELAQARAGAFAEAAAALMGDAATQDAHGELRPDVHAAGSRYYGLLLRLARDAAPTQAPACSCRAEAVHQAGCDTDRHA